MIAQMNSATAAATPMRADRRTIDDFFFRNTTHGSHVVRQTKKVHRVYPTNYLERENLWAVFEPCNFLLPQKPLPNHVSMLTSGSKICLPTDRKWITVTFNESIFALFGESTLFLLPWSHEEAFFGEFRERRSLQPYPGIHLAQRRMCISWK